MVLNRRHILLMGGSLALSGLSPRARANVSPDGARAIAFHNLHTGEDLAATYWAGGNYVPTALSDINHILRDFRTGDVAAIDPRLLDLLYQLRIRMEGDEPFHVISGYRSPKTNGELANQNNGVAKKSLHMKGMAIDVRLPGRQLDGLRQAAVALELGGVGYYPKSDFIHVDVGRVRYW